MAKRKIENMSRKDLAILKERLAKVLAEVERNEAVVRTPRALPEDKVEAAERVRRALGRFGTIDRLVAVARRVDGCLGDHN
jgi:hypothetical protein